MIVTNEDIAGRTVKTIKENNYAQYMIAGVCLIGDHESHVGEKIEEIPVIVMRKNFPIMSARMD